MLSPPLSTNSPNTLFFIEHVMISMTKVQLKILQNYAVVNARMTS